LCFFDYFHFHVHKLTLLHQTLKATTYAFALNWESSLRMMKFMLLLLNKKATKFNEVLVYVSVMNKKLQNYARKEDNELYVLNQCFVVAN
jgi:hypothetical protein